MQADEKDSYLLCIDQFLEFVNSTNCASDSS